MATLSSILVWEIPWTEEPGRLQSNAVAKRVGHDLVTKQDSISGAIFMVAKSCLTLCDPVDCSLPGSPVRRNLQARMLEWVAISSSRGSS